MSEDHTGPTIGDLAAKGWRLGLYCRTCARFRYMRTDRFGSDETVEAVARKLVCAGCRSKDLATRAVRPNEQTGRWPAEST